MVRAWVVQDSDHGMHGTRLGVVRAIHQPPNPRVDKRSRAHGARLNCSKQLTLAQAMIADRGTRFAQGDDFGVGRGIRVREIAIVSPANDLAVVNDNRPDRDFACLQCTLCGTQCFLHPKFVRVLVCLAELFHDRHCNLRKHRYFGPLVTILCSS